MKDKITLLLWSALFGIATFYILAAFLAYTPYGPSLSWLPTRVALTVIPFLVFLIALLTIRNRRRRQDTS